MTVQGNGGHDLVPTDDRAMAFEALRGMEDEREAERLASLYELGILDTESEQQYDDLVKLAAYICGTPMALISLVDRDRQWFKAKVGIEGEGTHRSEAVCSYTIQQDDLFIVEDIARDARFDHLPLVQSGELRFYAGTPISSPGGHHVGSLCVLDSQPRHLGEQQMEALRVLGRHAAAYLLIRKNVKQLQKAAEERVSTERELRHRQRMLEEANNILQQLASTDALTGLTNRRVLEARIAAQQHAPQKDATPLAVLMIDVDHFKKINDTLSHETGDLVLKRVAEVLRTMTRDSDTLCRYGGEEFVLLMPGATLEAAHRRAEVLRRAVAEDPQAITPITVSIGLACSVDDGQGMPVSMLLAEADRALYTAKHAGRNCVRTTASLWPAEVVSLAGD